MRESEILHEIFHSLQKNQKEKHDDLLEEAQSKIDSVKYSKTVLVELYPFENEIFGLDKGVELKGDNVVNKEIKKNYFSKNRRLVMTEDLLATNKVTGRSFYFYRDDFVERISFHKIGTFKLKSLSRFYNESGKLINKGIMGEACWNFEYINDSLTLIHVEEKEYSSGDIQKRDVELIYDEGKLLKEVINKYENGSSQVMYRRRR